MGNLISTFSSSSKESTSAPINDSSTWYPQPGQHISIWTYREQNRLQTSRPMCKKTETSLILEFSRSMYDQLEEVARLPMIHMPKPSIQARSPRPSIY
uniref:AC4 protein n=1 Tax=Potato yellow mosaic Panama virus TaxID=223307 RepID=A0A2R3P8K6_9GEMI|nr:AC4 protein [Potato yellow mosaic Panama virus]